MSLTCTSISNYTMLCQLCSQRPCELTRWRNDRHSFDFSDLLVLFFVFGWLDLQLWLNVQSSRIFVHGFAVYLVHNYGGGICEVRGRPGERGKGGIGGREGRDQAGWISAVTAPFASVAVHQRPNHQSLKWIHERLMSVHRRFLDKVCNVFTNYQRNT